MPSPPRNIATARLTLRPPVVADAEALFRAYTADAEVTKYLVWKPHADVGVTRAFLERCETEWLEGSAYPWVIEREGEPIGMVELRFAPPRVSVGYVLAPAHHGRGYMTEVVTHLKEWALAQPGIFRFWAVCDVENAGSRRVLEKSGLRLEGTLRAWEYHARDDRAPRDCFCFAATSGAKGGA